MCMYTYLYTLPSGAVALFSGFTNGAGQIWLDNVQCRGTEATLISCPANPLGSHNCVHGEDAGVRCQPAPGEGQTAIPEPASNI
jgi:hypothetical protein